MRDCRTYPTQRWRTSVNDLSSIKDKIRKMMALGAEGSGASEEEAATAMRMAMGLMARHGIDQATLGGAKPSAKMAARVERKLQPHEVMTAQAAGVLYGCRILFWKSGKMGFAFIGRPDNTDAAEVTMMWLTQQVEELYKAALPKGMTQRERAEYRKTFKVACAHRVHQRAVDFVNNPLQIATDIKSTALVVGDYFKQLQSENKEVMATMSIKKSRARGTQAGSGTMAGFRAGDSVQLHRRVG
jgi:Protein of unknown function (DUF2786)